METFSLERYPLVFTPPVIDGPSKNFSQPMGFEVLGRACVCLFSSIFPLTDYADTKVTIGLRICAYEICSDLVWPSFTTGLKMKRL